MMSSTQADRSRDAAVFAVQRLREAGHVALFAGGCVRDMLLGLIPQDYDVATDATPDQVGSLFSRARKVGAQFGVMLLRRDGFDIEVATFRTDGSYSDGRRPDTVTFSTAMEDAKRRDFTINGMFYDPIDEQIIDYVGGRDDLDKQIIRTIGDPESRFAEDHLRMLRAIRFASRLGFTIDPATMQAIGRLAGQLRLISAERIFMELEKILTNPSRATGWSLVDRSGLGDHLAPSWSTDSAEIDAVVTRLAALPHQRLDVLLPWATLLHKKSISAIDTICRDLRTSNELRKGSQWMVESLPMIRRHNSLELADLKLLLANDNWSELLALYKADVASDGESMDDYDVLCSRFKTVQPETISPAPLLTGDHLLDMGVGQSRLFGEIIEAVYRAQLNEQVNTLSQAKTLAKKIVERHKAS